MKYTFEDLFKLLLKRMWIIILCTIITSGMAFFITKTFIPSTYISNAQIYVTINENTKGMTSSEALAYSKNMTATYQAFLKTNEFLEKVKELSGSTYSINEIKNKTNIKSIDNTGIFTITVETNSIDESYKIAKAITELAPEKIKSIEADSNTRTIDTATKATTANSPNVKKNVMVGMILGFMISLVSIIVIDLFDTKIKNSQIIKDKYDIPVLGKIPTIK